MVRGFVFLTVLVGVADASLRATPVLAHVDKPAGVQEARVQHAFAAADQAETGVEESMRAAMAEAADARKTLLPKKAALLQQQLLALGPVCEDMCKEMGSYPDCQCAGFNGQPASSDDDRSCHTKYCGEGRPCPNDDFVMCVKENTKFLQVKSSAVPVLLRQLSAVQSSIAVYASQMSKQQVSVNYRLVLKNQVLSLGVACEDMCKSMGSYPNCQCAGFNGQPASSDDARGCYEQYCGAGRPCPNDGFVECVKTNTKLLQVESLPALFQQLTAVQSSIAVYTSQISK